MAANLASFLVAGLEEQNHQQLATKAIKRENLPWNIRDRLPSIIDGLDNGNPRQQRRPTSIIQTLEVSNYKPQIFYPTMNGADPSGGSDSTMELQLTINQAFEAASSHSLMEGIIDLGGVEVHLGGGQYVISKPLTLPDLGGGNVVIHGGTIRASNLFPADGFLLELATSELREEWARLDGRLAESHAPPAFENIVLQNLLLDANYTAGGILLLNPLRTIIVNCYITHFTTIGISVQGGHETLIHSSFLGQHITSGAHPLEQSFSGTAILISGNDNSVTDVVIFSAQTAIEVDGQANIITNVHCYNKATEYGGIGIIVRKGAIQTRILDSYLDYTGIVLEEPQEISVSDSFFLGDAYVLLRALNDAPSVKGVSIVNNIFHGSNHGVPIVQLHGNFSRIEQTYVDGNSATGMVYRSTRARASATRFGSEWTVDLSQTLLFPNSIAHVHYSFYALSTANNQNATSTTGGSKAFPLHALKLVTPKVVTVASDTPVQATVAIYVDQSFYNEDIGENSRPYL
ncbi:hypothetical protein L7F22_047832 [Adiantum nelumboides]|nr:hypothetical protein [Adiantum nelumboides]